jgi:glycine betaine/proline transport system substrate-binding protein
MILLRRIVPLITLALLPLLASGAGNAPLRLVYAEWSSSVANANLVCALVRERLGRDCRLRAVTAEQMWAQVADGRADAMLSAWLPETHRSYAKRYLQQVDDLGPNFEGTRIGLVVPDVSVGRQTGSTGARVRPHIPVQSIADLQGHRADLAGRIVGIEPGTGIMRATRRAIDAYRLDGFRLVEGTEASMAEALSEAVRRQEWIVVTGWTPHWMFGRWSLRFLDDPKGIYGHGGDIHTLARRGLREDMPKVYRLLDRFHWRGDELDQLMVWIRSDSQHDPYAQALRWLRTHPQRANEWLQ